MGFSSSVYVVQEACSLSDGDLMWNTYYVSKARLWAISVFLRLVLAVTMRFHVSVYCSRGISKVYLQK